MNNKVLKYAREEFQYNIPNLKIDSGDEKTVEVIEGTECNCLFVLSNDANSYFSGEVKSETQFIEVVNREFSGITNNIEIKINAIHLKKGDILKGIIRIFSDCGSETLTLIVKVISGVNVDGRLIKNIDEFCDYAKDNLGKAAKIFKSEAFEKNLTGDDAKHKMLYKSLKKNKNAMFAMEEYLVSIGAKKPVELLFDKNVININESETAWRQEITIRKSTWGYANCTVETDSNFITLESNRINDDSFKNGEYLLMFTCDPGFIKEGENFGHINIYSDVYSSSVEVVVSSGILNKIEFEDTIKAQKFYYNCLRLYVDYISGNFTFEEYRKNAEELLKNSGRDNSIEKLKKLLKLSLAVGNNSIGELKRAETEFANKEETLFDDDMDLYAEISYLLYKSKLKNPENVTDTRTETGGSKDEVINTGKKEGAKEVTGDKPGLEGLEGATGDKPGLEGLEGGPENGGLEVRLESLFENISEDSIMGSKGINSEAASKNYTALDFEKNLLSAYKSNAHSWKIPCLLIISDIEQYDINAIFNELIDYVNAGNSNPVLYYSICKLLLKEPSLFGDLFDGLVQVIHWGINNNLISKEISERYAYFAGVRRGFSEIVFEDMEKLYTAHGNVEYLKAICSMLISSQKNDKEYHIWYKAGIIEGLRITGLYEYYMYTWDYEDMEVIPEEVLEYFIYDTALKISKRASLYAYIVKNKEKIRNIFKAYDDIIRKFTLEQLANERINKDLATLYEEYITMEMIDEDYAELMTNILFCYEVWCVSPDIVGVYVRHPQIENEEFVPLVQGRAIINLYNEDAAIVLADANGNRYAGTVDYTVKKFIRVDMFLNKCYEYCKKDPGVLISLLYKKQGAIKVRENASKLRKSLYFLKGISKDFRRKLYSEIIIDFYEEYDTDELDKILKNLKWKYINPDLAGRIVEICVSRNNVMKAIEGIRLFGYEKVGNKALAAVSEAFLNDKDETEEYELKKKFAMHLFKKGKAEDNIIHFLCKNFDGTVADMAELYRVAFNSNIAIADLDERILVKAINTGESNQDVVKVFLRYIEKKGTNRTILMAFLNMMSYRYLIKGRELDIRLVPYMTKIVRPGDSRCIKLASLKALSNEEELPVEYKKFVEQQVKSFREQGVWLDFFDDFISKFDLNLSGNDYKNIQIISSPQDVINISYRVYKDGEEAKGEPKVELMQDVYEGIRIKRFLIFEDECVEYSIIREDSELMDGKVLKSGVISGKCDDEKTASFDYYSINRIIRAYNDGNSEEFLKFVREYAYKKALVESFEEYSR
ncbi:MAG: DUF5717 family protein [Lachnospiraceae bacterium]|nr:DUF5717 family protein [Lachnospiraceae bacterium]